MIAVNIHYPVCAPSPAHIPDDEQAHFVATFNRALRLSDSTGVASADIHMGQRTTDRVYRNEAGEEVGRQEGGWLEHTIVIRYKAAREGEQGRTMVVGAIQRKPGTQSEFHS